jgi:hypothetical protein
MTIYKVSIGERGDITTVTLRCPSCQTETTFRADKTGAPEGCPSCGEEVSPAMRTALGHLHRFHESAKVAEDKAKKPLFFFQIRTPEKA